MATTERTVVPRTKQRPATTKTPAHLSAQVIRKVMKAQWTGTDKELADAANFSVSTLSVLKNHGTSKSTLSFRKLCVALNIDAESALQGKISPKSSALLPDWIDQAIKLAGTKSEAHLRATIMDLTDRESRTHR